MAESLDRMLEPGERMMWRDPSRIRLMWPYFVMYGIVVAGLISPGTLHFTSRDWTWDLALFPAALVAICFAYLWITGRGEKRGGQGIVTNLRVRYRSTDVQSPGLEIPLAEVRGIALASSGAVEITRRDGAAVLLPGLWRPVRFAHAAAKAAQVLGPTSPGRLDLFGVRCWLLGGLAFVLAGELLSNTLMPDGLPSVVTELAGRVLLGVAAMAATLWIGAHLTCMLGLIAARPWISAGEVRAWLNAWPSSDTDKAPFHWTLWKSRPYFLLAEWLWGEPMNDPNEEVAAHG